MEEKQKSTGIHEGKMFIAQKGKAMCDKGTQFPQFKVSSHTLLFINDQEGENDYLAVTENDVMFNPAGPSFGNCSVKNGNPCAFAPAGIWQKSYKDVSVMKNCLLTEASELLCVTGGKITIMDHGQKAALTRQNVEHADNDIHTHLNPLVDMQEFKTELDGDHSVCL